MSLARSQFIVQLLEKLAIPLVASVSAASMRMPEKAAEGKDAEKVAALIGKATQVGVDLAKNLDLSNDTQADSVRVALAGVASPLVGHFYTMNGEIPKDEDLKKITSGLQTVLSFSDHFVASDENTQRMKNVTPSPLNDAFLSDEAQINVQYLQVFVPVMNAVSVFPFGKSEQKLMQDIASRLIGRSNALRESLFGKGLDKDTAKRVEMYVLKSMADMYTACHSEETARLMTTQSGQADINVVWDNFDKRSAMLETLMKGVFDVSVDAQAKSLPQSSSTTDAEQNAPQPAQSSQTTPDNQAPVGIGGSGVAPSSDGVQGAADQGAKTAGSQQQSETQPQAPSFIKETAEQPPTTPAEAIEPTQQAAPLPQSPAESQETQSKQTDSDDDGDDDDGDYNPMSFFSGKSD